MFYPATTTDSATREGLFALMSSSSPRVRDCLLRQVGRPAERNSCEGPWTATLNASMHTSIPFPFGRYVSISLAFANPLGGLDQLLHGSSHLRGWGLSPIPDPVLYTVRGFDPAAKTFSYQVNPRFGNTAPASSILRSPFRVTLDISTTLGQPIPLQQLKRLVSAGRNGKPGKRLDSDALKKRYRRNVPDPYAQILEESDSLLITAEQSEAIEAADADYLRGIDSIWTPLTDYLAGLGDTFDVTAAVKRQEDTSDAAWEYGRQHVQKTLGKILSPIQLKLLPWVPALLYNAKKPLHVGMYGW